MITVESSFMITVDSSFMITVESSGEQCSSQLSSLTFPYSLLLCESDRHES